MGAAPKRLCRNCGNIATVGRYCERHKDAQRRTNREYRDPELSCLYNRRAWKLTREQALFDHPICQYVDPAGVPCPRLATDVHHKIPARRWIAMGKDFCDPGNLECLCHQHHSRFTATEVGFAGNNRTRAMRRLLQGEKELRGTHQECLDRPPRTVAEIEEDIRFTHELMSSLEFQSREAMKEIKRLGPSVKSGRGAQNSFKPNPCLKILNDSVTARRKIIRELAFLHEELELAKAAEAPPEDEFAGL